MRMAGQVIDPKAVAALAGGSADNEFAQVASDVTGANADDNASVYVDLTDSGPTAGMMISENDGLPELLIKGNRGPKLINNIESFAYPNSGELPGSVKYEHLDELGALGAKMRSQVETMYNNP